LQDPGGKSSAHPHELSDLQHGTKYGMQAFVHDDALHPEPPLLPLPLLLPPLLDVVRAAHAFAWHVWLLAVQSWHVAPLVPHAVSSVPPLHAPVESQQPLAHV
jgi:hypothetical protein